MDQETKTPSTKSQCKGPEARTSRTGSRNRKRAGQCNWRILKGVGKRWRNVEELAWAKLCWEFRRHKDWAFSIKCNRMV